MRRRALLFMLVPAALLSLGSSVASPVPDAMLDGLSWRLIGPHRAGWSTVAVGVPQRPETFYFGAAGGGVWKTTDAGRTWAAVFDDGPPSIGALAVAPSDPNTIYVGTGQVTSRYDGASPGPPHAAPIASRSVDAPTGFARQPASPADAARRTISSSP